MTADAERPILFSGPMVRALLAGTKTQTRRVVKPQPPGLWMKPETAVITDHHGRWAFSRIAPNGMAVAWPRGSESIKCPYGIPGDTLWVREAFAPRYFDDGSSAYRADWNARGEDVVPEPKWKPSIHMPRWASRITLRVTDVRVQRVRKISERDAQAEGAAKESGIGGMSYVNGFHRLWGSINAARGYGWDVDPWVWALTFERVTP